MDKISLPFRIVLIVALVFAVVWFLVLRPKPAADGEPAVTPPGVTGLANDVAKANKAVDASKAAAARSEGAANAVGGSSTTATTKRSTTATTKPSATAAKPGTTSATAKPAKPAKSAKPTTPAAVAKPAKPGLADDAAPGDPSRPLLASVDAGKVVVVLFWNKNASDDRATRRALRVIDLHDGKVAASAVPIGDVGRYEAITRGVQVLESPTVLVIGAGGKARAITGYTQAKEIDQAVSDIGGKGFEARKAFRLTGLAAVADDVCKDFHYAVDQKADPPTTVSELSKVLGIAEREQGHGVVRLTRAKASGTAERVLKSSMIAFARKDAGWVNDAQRQLHAGANPGNVFLTLVQLEIDGGHTYQTAAKKLRVRGCYANA